jgi:polar amino acid transport system substrate-binding protein
MKVLTHALIASLISLLTVSGNAFAQGASASTWERLKEEGVLRVGCLDHPLNHHIDGRTGEWEGWVIDAVEQLVKDLKPIGVTEWECVQTTWGTAALNIQSGKIDLMFNLQATPLRATAISFAGPLFEHGVIAVNSSGFSPGPNWEDYNNSDVKIAVAQGTSTVAIMEQLLPNATQVMLPNQTDVPLAVASGRADAMIEWAMPGIIAKMKNPQLGDFVVPEPAFTFPQYVGVARDTDGIFADFMQWWVEWNNRKGNFEMWLKDELVEVGLPRDSLPDRILR